MTKTRPEAFSDGVLAIAITLLVISTVKAGHLSLVTRPGDVTKVILFAIDATDLIPPDRGRRHRFLGS